MTQVFEDGLLIRINSRKLEVYKPFLQKLTMIKQSLLLTWIILPSGLMPYHFVIRKLRTTIAYAVIKVCSSFDILHSDQGRNFESTLFPQVLQAIGIHKTRTTAYHP